MSSIPIDAINLKQLETAKTLTLLLEQAFHLYPFLANCNSQDTAQRCQHYAHPHLRPYDSHPRRLIILTAVIAAALRHSLPSTVHTFSRRLAREDWRRGA